MRKLTQEEVIKKFIEKHGNRYKYSLVCYINYRLPVQITCNKHGNFWQTPNSHLNCQGCPKCKLGKNELLIGKFLEENNINHQTQYKIKLPCNKENYSSKIDFCLPEHNLLIEYNGEQHFRPICFGKNKKEAESRFDLQQIRDQQLEVWCKENYMKILIIDGRKYQSKKLKTYLETELKSLLMNGENK